MVGTESSPETHEAAGDLIAQLKSILEYKWEIAGIALIAILATALVVFSKVPVYRATNSIVIEYRQSNVLGVSDVYETGSGAKSYYSTQITVLASRDMAKKAVERIDWDRYPDFLKPSESGFDKLLNRVADKVPALRGFLAPEEQEAVESTEEALYQARTNAFMAATNIEPVIYTQVVKIHFLSSSSQLAVDAANALADAFIESGFEAQFEATRRATNWLNERLSGVKGRLADSESALQQFREKQDILNIGGGKGVLEAELSDHMQRLRDAERVKNQLQNTYSQVRQAGYTPYLLQQIPVLLEDDLVRSTKQSFISAENEVSQLRPRYGPKHPAMIKAQARLKEAQDSYHQQLRRAADGVRSKYESAEKTVRSLTGAVQKTRNEIRGLDRQDYNMQVLAREADANAQLYDTILRRFKEADVTGDFQALKARVIDPAILPNKPYLPNKRRALMFAAIFGTLAGFSLALLRHHLDTSVKTGDDLEKISGKPVFASVAATGGRLFAGSIARLIEDKPRSAFSEGVRTVRTGILLSDLDKKKKRILVTSALPQEGKTSLATNLALAFSQMEKVLLIDCDLRKPNVPRLMGLKGAQAGISELLRGDIDRKALAIHQVAPNVDLLPVGRQLPSPGQVLTSARFRTLLDEVCADYDRVIIDSAPCQPVSDTLLLANQVDGVVFVVRYDSTGIKIVQTALKKLAKSRAPILGMVLNRVDHRRAVLSGDSYYYGDGYYK